MKCPNCGAELMDPGSDSGRICSYCGSRFEEAELGRTSSPDGQDRAEEPGAVVREIHHYHHKPDRLSFPMGCLCFFFFPAGIVYYLINREDFPRKAKAALLVSLAAVVIFLITRLASAPPGFLK